MSASPEDVRRATLERLAALGFRDLPAVPLLEGARVRRTLPEVRARMLCIHTALVLAYRGMTRKATQGWVERAGLGLHLSPGERQLVARSDRDLGVRLMHRVEALWALAWAAGRAPALDPLECCSDELATWFPDPRQPQAAPQLELPGLRGEAELIAACDLFRCLEGHAFRSGLLLKPLRPGVRATGYSAMNRRLALEWLLVTDRWDRPDGEPDGGWMLQGVTAT
ncbi:DUF4272 domain-containing protein [Anaeromyxobacter diazotrophicus]|uniref:Uncharacterized protein n=1 Tax=Anaeromyxobacter diazotrophicus TaxID=2590199 RepID=A0A7I9VR21_9BACT|nr:DUF4272 domain-containing protein [Anaeromyxobacter diazotrophicus]GEJ58872.1 hypothetical protein AMYX_36130 [Anaeromyxobacter diazotrophicus]